MRGANVFASPTHCGKYCEWKNASQNGPCACTAVFPVPKGRRGGGRAEATDSRTGERKPLVAFFVGLPLRENFGSPILKL